MIIHLFHSHAYNKPLFERHTDKEAVYMANCAIVGINWGDEGKGRMVDYLTGQYLSLIHI